jgi:signal transduction histidine kinase
MKERARLMGGELRVISEPSGGTTVDVVVPVRGEELR